MRYIDIKKIRLPEGWLEEAAQALDDVRNGSSLFHVGKLNSSFPVLR